MVGALDYGLKGLGSSLGPGHCVLLGCIPLTFNWKFPESNEDKQESNSNDPQTTFDLPCVERLSCQLQYPQEVRNSPFFYYEFQRVFFLGVHVMILGLQDFEKSRALRAKICTAKMCKTLLRNDPQFYLKTL